ncbi:substrate-binding domain-containing protein [Burkholderia stabilis]|uniref:Phosphate ABC transporter substrate-binding protein n=1 Tax=Burkholderia stabilis TaxID=95485 RepID=A0A1Y1BT49_9BURK|nr:substrate-binding domain-containing protein [Burkholderia stabilis]BAX61429.1 phosphate ABC transporter substrate-binding protein [Burkholderia stabilis]
MRLHQPRRLCQLIALASSSLSVTTAMAAPNVQGGGSSLVAPAIGTIGIPATEIGLFGTAEGSFTYYTVGSGAGQNAFLRNQSTFLSSGATGPVYFANSDAALTTYQVTSYQANVGTTSGPLIQIPYIVTPITVPVVNGPAVTSTTTPQTTPGQAHSIALDDDDLCGIFSGKLTNWNQITNPETGSVYVLNEPIKVVYRSDGSGTTELLTRHLAAVCTTVNTATGATFVDSLTFSASFPGGVMPANFIAATYSLGVRNALSSSIGTAFGYVAYLSPNYTNTFLAPSSTVVTSAGALQLPVASLVNAKNGVYYAPTYANATMGLGTITPPMIRPTAANPVNWVDTRGSSVRNPTSGYPVSGMSYIILSQCYADPAVGTAMHDFLNAHYTNASFASIVRGNGFDTVPVTFQRAIANDFLSNVSTWNFDIGNTSVCTGMVTGR